MNYSDYFDVKHKIELLKKLSAQNAIPDKFLPVLEKLLFDKFTINCFPIGDQFIYRARKNEYGRLFTDIGELKHPRLSSAKGRMNDVGESFFYGALCELGTIYEMVPTIGSLFTISKISTKSGILQPLFKIVGLLDDYRSSITPKNKTEKTIYNYLHGEFIKVTTNADEYNSTIAISRLLLSKDIVAPDYCLCGLAYPSVQKARGVANVRTINIGMKGEAFDDNFCIIDTFVYCLTDEEKTYQLNEINRGEIEEDGCINWMYSFSEMQQRMRSGLTLDGTFVEKLRSYADQSTNC
ncbi:hypothetical protein [Methylomonas sp. AM2-LC]|uniref:hypothetical protein n=1 Tax=Methylomonas sp. AM2-LC TaxID=3153301 RepID=UPI0032654A01